MSLKSRRNSLVEQVRGFIHRPSPHATDQNLIELGTLDVMDVLGYSLHKEAVGGSRKSLKKILISTICVDYPNDRGQTPLFCACSRDREGNALLLLQYGANPNEKSQEGVTPTHAACYVGNIYLLGKLIEAGGDLRLHDNEGNSMRDWALQNPDPKRRAKMLEFLDKTHVCAMAYSGDAVKTDKFMMKANKQTSLMEVMKMRTGSNSSFENLKRVQSMGFGKVYLGGDFSGGIVSVVPLVSEALLEHTDNMCFDTGFGTFMEQMEWMHMQVSVKQVKQNVQPEEGIDNIISEAEFLGKLRHPNIALLMGICQSTSLENMWLIFEHFEEATLYHMLYMSQTKLQLTRKKSIIDQICKAMEFIHNQNLIHCGLSSMAIYLASPYTSKVGNLEFMVESMKADLGKPSRVSSVSHGRFLYNWMAPEVMREEAPHFSSDVYSFCCLIWEIFASEVPWTGLEPGEIFQKLVEENIALNLNYSPIPAKLKAIVGYGLELREEDRLHKFSLISNWLKSEEVPQFERNRSPVRWVNKSCNHTEMTSSSSHSSSVRSNASLKVGGGSSTGQEFWTQDKFVFNKRFSLDFESQVHPAFPSSSTVDFSHLDTTKAGSSISICGSDTCTPPCKPPRAFGARLSNPSASSSKTKHTDRDSTSPRESMSSQKRETKGSPGSPSRIKPASHSYQSCSVYSTTSATGGSGSALSREKAPADAATSRISSQPWVYSSNPQLIHEETEEDTEPCSVKAMADKYQNLQDQHKLRQAILKGSMAPRGSCQNLGTSTESFTTESLGTDLDVEGLTVNHSKQLCELGSLNGTPLLKNSSTPKGALPSTSEPAKVPGLHEKTDQRTSHKHNESKIQVAKSVPDHMQTKVVDKKHAYAGDTMVKNTPDEDFSIRKYRAFIDDIKHKYIHVRRKSLTGDNLEVSPGSLYHSPVLRFHSPCKEGTARKVSLLPQGINQDTENVTEAHAFKNAAGSSIPGEAMDDVDGNSELFPQIRETPLKGASIEDDSFWAVTPLVTKEQENIQGNMVPVEREGNACSILHADYPEKGFRVIMRADGPELSTTYYNNSEHLDIAIIPPASLHEEPLLHKPYEETIEPLAQRINTLQGKGVQPSSSGKSLKLDRCSEASGEAERHTLSNEKEGCDLDGTFTVDDKGNEDKQLNETFTLDNGPLFPQNSSFGSDKVIQWVDNQLDKIKDNLSQKSDKSTGSNNSQCRIEEILTPGLKEELSVVTKFHTKTFDVNGCISRERFCLETGLKACASEEVNNDDFEFPEYYIEDELEKGLQHVTPSLSVPFLPRSTTDHIQRKTVPKDLPNTFELQSNPTLTSFNKTLDHKPPVIPKSKIKLSENICQSAMIDNTELDDVRCKILSRRSLSDKDLASPKHAGVHLIAKGQGSSRGREGVPVKPGAKQSFASDGLRSGASDPSFSTSLMRESKADMSQRGEGAAQQAAAATEEVDFEEENTLMIMSQDFSEEATEGTRVQLKNADMAGRVEQKDEASQVMLDASVPVVLVEEKRYDLDSVDSDLWVKGKLSDIQSKIKRRKARPTYEASSDEDEYKADTGYFIDDMPQPVRLPSTQTLPKYTRNKSCPDFKAKRSTSCHDLSIQIDKIYSNVMEELKVTCKARKLESDKCSARETRRKSFPLDEASPKGNEKGKPKKCVSKQPLLPLDQSKCPLIKTRSEKLSHGIGSKEKQREYFSKSGHFYSRAHHRSYESESHRGCSTTYPINDRAYAPANVTQSFSDRGASYQGKNHVALGSKNSSSSLHAFKSLQRNDCVDSPQWEEKGSVRKESSRRSILRRPSKESMLSKKSVPQLLPGSKLKLSPSQNSKSTDRAISFEDVTEDSNEDKNPDLSTQASSMQVYGQSFTSRQSKIVSTTKTTENWLHEQHLRQKSSPRHQDHPHSENHQDHPHAEKRHKRVGSMSRLRNVAQSTGSRHSVVSFSKCESLEKVSSHSRHCSKSVGKRKSPHHRHEASSFSSSSSTIASQKRERSIRNRKSNVSEKVEEFTSGRESLCYRREEVPSHQQSSLDCTEESPLQKDKVDDQYLTVGLEHTDKNDEGDKNLRGQKRHGKAALGLHRFYIPRESWPDGCSAKLNVEVSKVSQRVTTTATNPASGHTELLLDQVFTGPKLKSSIKME